MDELLTRQMPHSLEAEQAAREKAQAQEIAEKLKNITVEIKAKSGNGGRLFGSITSQEVSDALKKQAGISVDKKKIVQDEPIKSFGDFSLKAKLGYEIVATISVHVSEG